jgi:Holliday junction resolvasome RuvABC endonuclease subunit
MSGETNASAMAIYPMTRGYGFVLFESAGAGADWGARFIEGNRKTRNGRTVAHVGSLLDRYQPDVLVLEDYRTKEARRSDRLKNLHRAIVHAAQTRAIETVLIKPREVRAAFRSVGATTTYEIAQAVARQFPPLSHRIPAKRRTWDAESPTMAMFRAAALAITFYGAGAAGEGSQA